jgi:hypothetical protein
MIHVIHRTKSRARRLFRGAFPAVVRLKGPSLRFRALKMHQMRPLLPRLALLPHGPAEGRGAALQLPAANGREMQA